MTWVGLLVIDLICSVAVLAGLWLSIRAGALAQRFSRRPAPDGEAPDIAGVAAVIRMAGVMLTAFGVVIGAFANLIVYYTANPPT
jgi:hypothetical protein